MEFHKGQVSNKNPTQTIIQFELCGEERLLSHLEPCNIVKRGVEVTLTGRDARKNGSLHVDTVAERERLKMMKMAAMNLALKNLGMTLYDQNVDDPDKIDVDYGDIEWNPLHTY